MQRHIMNLKIVWYGLLVTLLLVTLGVSFSHRQAVESVGIKLRADQVERSDHGIPFLTDQRDRLPDYRVEYLTGRSWFPIGTAFNRSAANWIHFPLSDPPNLSLVQAIRVTEDDRFEDDPLDEVMVAGQTRVTGSMFEFQLQTSPSFKAGMAWFASTALGKAIFAGIMAAVFLVVISYVGFPLS